VYGRARRVLPPHLVTSHQVPSKTPPKILATGMVEAAKLHMHIEGGSPCEYPHKDLYINRTIQDSRYIPCTEGGLVIRKKFLKYYLEKRLEEYLALGGLQELIERRTLFIQGYKLPDPFYWDLWGNLEHLRDTYVDYCAEEHFDPEASEEESVASLDTQA